MNQAVRKTARRNLIECLYEFASEEIQYYWVHYHEDICVSYIECMCTYFDDLGLKEGLDKAVERNLISKAEASALHEFHAIAELYVPADENDNAQILNDKQWKLVVIKAQKAWKAFKKLIINEEEVQLISDLESKFNLKF